MNQEAKQLTLNQLYAIRKGLHSQQSNIPANILIVPHDDTACGRFLEEIKIQHGVNFESIGTFFVHIQDVLGARIQGADSAGLWWELPPTDNDTTA